MKKVFIIEDKFEVVGKGIALVGITDDDSQKIVEGESVLIKEVGLQDIDTKALGFELMRNCWAPHKPRNMCLLIPNTVGIDNIRIKSEVWANV